MEKSTKVVSKRLQKQLKKLARNGHSEEAVKLLEPIAQEGNPNAQYQLGQLLFDAMMDKKDYTGIEKVVYWYEEAAKQGYAKAMAALGELYFPGSWDTWMGTIKQSPTFTLHTDLHKSLSYFVKASENGEWLGATNSTSIYNLLHSRTATDDEKNDTMQMLVYLAKEGDRDAANDLLHMWMIHFRFPDRAPDVLHLTQNELLHTDWFLLLLDYETECEKKHEYSGTDATRLLSDLAEKGNQEALDMLTKIGMQVGKLIACWAGDIHYKRQEYETALKCYQLGEYPRMMGQMYERGEGTAPDAEKAFHYYEEAGSYCNMGRMYEQGIGTQKDLWKAFECYREIIDRKIYEHDSEEEKNEILSVRRSFRRLKKILFAQKDEIRMTVAINKPQSAYSFSFISYGDCLFTIDWGDGQVEEMNNEKGEEIHMEHTYIEPGEWHICLRSDETHTITSFHYACETCTLKALDVTQCPILIDLYCVNQALKHLDVSQNPRLERLVCRGNKLRALNIRKNYCLTQLDCSDNPLRRLDWHPRYSALAKVCMKNTQNSNQIASLYILLKSNKGEECERITETPLEPVFLPLSYYMRCMDWSGVKAKMKEGGYPIIKCHSLEQYKSAFDDMRSRKDFCYTGIDRIVCEGGYTYYWLYSHREKKYVHQDLEDVLMNSTPWSETLDMPVEIREKEGWMMLPQVTWADVFCACFSEMTNSHWQETEEIVREEREFWEKLRQRQEKYV